MLTLDSTIKSIVVQLNLEGNGYTLRKAAKEIGINEKRLSTLIKHAGYTFHARKWHHKDYEDPAREKTVRESLEHMQIEKASQSIVTSSIDIHNALQDLGSIERVTKSLAADKETLNDFERFCVTYNVMRSRALTLAIKEFIEKYS